MEDITPIDAALNSGYYQPTAEVLPWIVLAIGLLSAVMWALNRR